MGKRIFFFLIFLQTTAFACKTDGLYPDKECTPGDIFPTVTLEQICTPGYSATVRNVPKSLKDKVFDEYNIPVEDRKKYVIDHLISLQIGGTNNLPNLFPQQTFGEINSRTKDKIENYLKREVCKGDMTLKEAQESIVKDWIAIYEDYSEKEE